MLTYRWFVVLLIAVALRPGSAWAGFTYSDFSSTAGLTFVGDAHSAADRLRLTRSTEYEYSAAWYNVKQNVQAGFDTTFPFRITYPDSRYGGADGFAFVIQNSSASAMNGPAGGLGYGGYPGNATAGIPNSLAIEFDTFQNNWDPNGNHVSVQSRGLLNNSVDHAYSLGVTTAIPTLEDGAIHTARIQYLPVGSLRVFVDDLVNPVLTVPVDLATQLSLDAGHAWVGLTGATGAGWENIEVHNWTYVPEPGSLALLALGALALVRRRAAV